MKPTPGQTYTTQHGETFESIAAQAYGDPMLANNIQSVNPMQVIVSLSDELPLGTSLIIPVDQELETLRNEQLKQGLQNAR